MLNLKSLPPTQIAFRGNVKRAHLATATMKFSLSLDPPPLVNTDPGWYPPDYDILLPVVTLDGSWLFDKTNQMGVQISWAMLKKPLYLQENES